MSADSDNSRGKKLSYQWKENNRCKILEFLSKGNCQSTFMRDSETSQKSAKDRVYTDDIREEGRGEHEHNRERHEQRCGSVLSTSCLAGDPEHEPLYGDEDDERPGNRGKQDVQRGKT